MAKMKSCKQCKFNNGPLIGLKTWIKCRKHKNAGYRASSMCFDFEKK